MTLQGNLWNILDVTEHRRTPLLDNLTTLLVYDLVTSFNYFTFVPDKLCSVVPTSLGQQWIQIALSVYLRTKPVVIVAEFILNQQRF